MLNATCRKPVTPDLWVGQSKVPFSVWVPSLNLVEPSLAFIKRLKGTKMVPLVSSMAPFPNPSKGILKRDAI